jgi:Leucine-rich repeat (LRR) protein
MLDLSLVDSDFSSEIPIELGQLRLLNNLSLLGNKLTGTFPTEIGNLLNLEILRLGDNALTGAVPTQLLLLTNLDFLYLSSNKNLTGPFACPDFIEDCFVSCEDSTPECRILE